MIHQKIATVGAGALVFQKNKVLLVQLNYGRFKGQWILPGGLLEAGEDPASAAIRELEEETNQVGRVMSPHSIRFRKEPTDIYWVFNVELTGQRPLAFPKEELMDVKYWLIEEALNSNEVRPMTRYFIRTALAASPGEEALPKEHTQRDKVFFTITSTEQVELIPDGDLT